MPTTHNYHDFILRRELGKSVGTAPTVYKVKLYASITVPPDVDTIMTHITEMATAKGYTQGGTNITMASFTVTKGSGVTPTKKVYAPVIFTFTESGAVVGGYYVTADYDSTTNIVIFAEAGAFTSTGTGDTYTVTLVLSI